MQYGNKIQRLSCQKQFGEEHYHILCVDGSVFPQSLKGNKQEKPINLQRVFSGELQTTNR